MSPAPESDLARLVRGMRPRLIDEPLVYVTLPPGVPVPAGVRVLARVEEDEGTTLVVPADADLPDETQRAFPCARITLEVHSSLEAVGFLAVITAALAGAGIGVNPVAGFHHDHLFVPHDERHRALGVLVDLTATDPQSSTDPTHAVRPQSVTDRSEPLTR